MKCPNCNQRNSVAARKCFNCSTPLPIKPMPKAVKISILAGIAFVVILPLLIKFALSNINIKTDVNQSLKTEQNEQDWSNLRLKIESFLNSRTTLSKAELDSQLKTFLKDSNCEIHIFDISTTCKVVEIGKNLFSSLFIIIPNKPKIIDLNKINVYEDGRVTESNKQKLLILLGHTSADIDRISHPAIINLDTMEDLTSLYLPHLPENAKFFFTQNSPYLNVKLSILALLQTKGLDPGNVVKFEDETIDCILQPTANGSFELDSNWFDYKLGPIYVISKLMFNPNQIDLYKPCISPKKTDLILLNLKMANAKLSNQPFTFKLDLINKRVDGHKNILNYGLTTNDNYYIVQILSLSVKDQKVKYYINGFSSEKNPFKSIDNNDNSTNKAQTNNLTQTTDALTTAKTQTKPADNNVNPNNQSDKSINLNDNLNNQNSNSINLNDNLNNQSDKSINLNDNPQTENVATSFSKINIRKSAKVDSKIISILPSNGKITVISKDNGWYKVKLKSGDYGYIYGGLLKADFKEAYKTIKINQDSDIKNDQQKTIGKLNTGDRVVILQDLGQNQLKVKLANGKVGIINQSLLLNTQSNPKIKSDTKASSTKKLDIPQFVP